MKRTRIIGLCMLAACAIFALTASSALATENLPHYGKCEALTGGVYTNSGCTKVAKPGTGKFEWHPLTAAVPFKSAKEKSTGAAVLESAGGTEISCTGQGQKEGEYGPGGDEVKNTVGEFTGCKALGASCNSEGQPAEHINTKKLHGEPGIVKKEAKEEKNIDGNDLRAQVGTELAAFACGPAPVLVRGGVVVKASSDSTGGTTGEITNKMEQKIEVEFITEKPGKEVPREWIPNGTGVTNAKHELIVEHLEGSTAGQPFEESGQSLTTVQETTVKTVKVELRQCEKTISCPN